MADTKLSALTALAGADTASGDLFYVDDVSVTTSKSITRAELAIAMNATQAEQETSTATNKLVSPAVQQYHPSSPKAWLRMTCVGGTPSIVSSYNVTSITDNGPGDYTVNFTVAFSDTNYCGIGYTNLALSSSAQDRNCMVVSVTAGAFRFLTQDGSGVTEDNHVYTTWVWYGDQ